ncbi:MAG: NAD-dependent epimerase/dehydratase family protein [Dehalococcoidia bacterium]
MRILVTGGAGYIGSVLVPMLLDAGHHVRVLDILRKGGQGLFPLFANPRLEFVHGDVRDEDKLREALRGSDAIIHLAAIVGYPACRRDPWLAMEVNYGGTAALNRQRHRGQLLLFASSLSNYGHAADGLCTEESEPTPITIYGQSKIRAEQEVLSSDDNVIVFRPATAFGLSPQMRLDLLFNEFVYRAVKERFLAVYQPYFMRAFVHVRDFAGAFLFALEHADRMRSQVFNLGDESLNVTKGDLAERVRRRLDFELHFSEAGEDPDKRNYAVSFAKLKSVGFSTQVTIEEGIDELARGYQVLDIPNPYANASYY